MCADFPYLHVVKGSKLRKPRTVQVCLTNETTWPGHGLNRRLSPCHLSRQFNFQQPRRPPIESEVTLSPRRSPVASISSDLPFKASYLAFTHYLLRSQRVAQRHRSLIAVTFAVPRYFKTFFFVLPPLLFFKHFQHHPRLPYIQQDSTE